MVAKKDIFVKKNVEVLNKKQHNYFLKVCCCSIYTNI